MGNIKFANFAKTTLALGCTDSAVTINVSDGAIFPSITTDQYFMLVLEDATLNREIVKCTAKATNALTVVRAQEGTAARAWNQGDRVALRMTSGAFEARIAEVETDLDTRVDALEAQVTSLANGVPIGEPFAWFLDTPPTGAMECDGSACSRTTYADLFAKIGTRFGAGDGSTTFNLPDLRGEFLRGYSHTSSNDPDAANRLDRGDGTTGNAIGTKQTSAILDHPTYLFTGNAGSGVGSESGGFGTTYNGGTVQVGAGLLDSADGGQFINGAFDSGFHTNQVSVYETRPRNVSVMYCIRYE